MSNLRGEENTAKKLEILIEYHQLKLGLWMSIFDKDTNGYLSLLTNTWLVQVIKRMRERNLSIKTNKKCHWLGEAPTIMERVIMSDMSWDDKRKMNLCRMIKKVMYRDNLYDLKGQRKQSREKTGRNTTLLWPKNRVPRTCEI